MNTSMKYSDAHTELGLSAYDKALEFATQKHNGQFRIGGEPYITHPIAVAAYVREWGYGIDYQIAALFHDLLEDTDATEEEICNIGGDLVLEIVKLLTKPPVLVMADYVKGIRNNEMAKIIKTADRLHNLRSAVITSTSFRKKYVTETIEWYYDFSPEIGKAVDELIKTLKKEKNNF